MNEQKLSSLIVDVRPGERLDMSGRATVELLHKSGQLVRLRITAPREVQISKELPQKAVDVVPSMAP